MRTCIVEPTGALLQASDLIAAAGDHLIKGDRGLAAEALVEADAPELLALFLRRTFEAASRT